jgi:hypothetical protein
MDINGALEQLKAKRAQLERAIEALSDTTMDVHGQGRRGKRRKHNISPAGRRRLSLMMKRRWAERRKAKKAA